MRNIRTDSREIDVLRFYGEEEAIVSTYSPEEIQFYGESINPDIVKPRVVAAPVVVEKKRGRQSKKVVTEI